MNKLSHFTRTYMYDCTCLFTFKLSMYKHLKKNEKRLNNLLIIFIYSQISTHRQSADSYRLSWICCGFPCIFDRPSHLRGLESQLSVKLLHSVVVCIVDFVIADLHFIAVRTFANGRQCAIFS